LEVRLNFKHTAILVFVFASTALGQTKIAPDCPVLLSPARTTTGTSSVYDNRPQSTSTSPCTEWVFHASATTANSSFTVLVQSAQDNGAAACAGCTWSTFASLTLSAEGVIVATKSYGDYIRVNLTAISGGAVSAALEGWRGNQTTAGGGGGGGGGCAVSMFPDGSIVFTESGACDSSANLVWDNTNDILEPSTVLIGSNDSAALAALDTALSDEIQLAPIGDGSATYGSLFAYSGTNSSPGIYLATSGGTFSAPSDSPAGPVNTGTLYGVYYQGGWQEIQFLTTQILDTTTGESLLFVGIPGTPVGHVTLNGANVSAPVIEDSNGYVASGTYNAITPNTIFITAPSAGQRATTGQVFTCLDTNGQVVASATACVGTI